MSSSVLLSASSAADALIDGRVVPSTKAGYQRKINIITLFYEEHLDGKIFTLPVEWPDIKSFFGWLIDIKHKDKPAAFSTVRQYKSALVWYYKECKLTLSPDTNQELEIMLNGYQRRVSNYKLEGKMPVFEGKYHLTFDGYFLLARALFTAEAVSQIMPRCCSPGLSSCCSGT
jgi:hypothetical protein